MWVSSNVKYVSKHTKQKMDYYVITMQKKINDITEPTKCSTSTPIDQVTTVVNTVS